MLASSHLVQTGKKRERGGKRKPQFFTIYFGPPKSQMSGVTFQFGPQIKKSTFVEILSRFSEIVNFIYLLEVLYLKNKINITDLLDFLSITKRRICSLNQIL